MTALFKFEIRKLFMHKSLYICAAVLAVMAFINAAMGNTATDIVSQIAVLFDGETTPDGFKIMLSSAYNSNYMLILGVFTAIYACGDFATQTIKNVYGRGFTRTQVFFSKYTVSLISALFLYIITLSVAFLFGSMMSEFGTPEEGYLKYFAGQIAAVIAICTMFFSISVALKSLGGAIAVNILSSSVITTILAIIDITLADKEIDLSVSLYWINKVFADMSSLYNGFDGKRLTACLICSGIYVAVFLVLGWLIHRKSEK